MSYSVEPIALVRSPFREKFSTPRQPGLIPSVTARIELLPDFATSEAVRGLEEFSHIWLLFLFHQTSGQGWKPTVRPPRLGGNTRVGVFASRSPFRPNPIGLSAVKLLSIEHNQGQVSLKVQGADLVDGTPILDIKPYLTYTDAIPSATGGYAQQAPPKSLQVEFTDRARQQLERYRPETPDLEKMIGETLALDPRPAYRQGKEDQREYGVLFDRYNLRWLVEGDKVLVVRIELAK